MIRLDTLGLAGGGQAALAQGEPAIHHVGRVGDRIAILDAKLMAQLVQDGGQSIDASRRAAAGGGKPARASAGELAVIERSRIDEPGVARRVGVERDHAIARLAEIPAGQVVDGKCDAVQQAELLGGEAGRFPARDCGDDERIEFGLR